MVCFETKYVPGDHVFVNMSPLEITAAECLTTESYSKPMTRRRGSYAMLRVGAKYRKILQEGVETSFIINRVTRLIL